MENLALAQEIATLPAPVRLAVERLVRLLKAQLPAPTAKSPPVLYPADPAQVGRPFTDSAFFGAWADRTDIASGAEYIHDVRRGLRAP